MKYLALYLWAFCLCLYTGVQAESVEIEGSDGSILLIQFDSQGQVETIASSDGLITSDTPPSQWTKVLRKYSHNLKPLRNHLTQLFNFDNMWSDIGQIGNELLPESLFFFFGFRREEAATGVEGQFEFSSKVRFTAINGVLNDLAHARSSAKMISECTGGVRVHYIYRPTVGWPGDLFGAILTYTGISSPMAIHLANKWRELIAEMGGVEGGGHLIHYSHSLGGVDSLFALKLLTREEADMIEIHAFASPQAIPPGRFRHAVTYCSSQDNVWFLDPIGYYKHNVVYEKSDGVYMYDHRWNSPTYMRLLIELGKKWIEMYGSKDEEMERNGVEPLASTMPLLRSTN